MNSIMCIHRQTKIWGSIYFKKLESIMFNDTKLFSSSLYFFFEKETFSFF